MVLSKDQHIDMISKFKITPLGEETAKKYQILVVDDEKENLEALSRLLRNCGQIYCAENVYEARKLTSKITFSLILCDQRLPGISGLEFLKEVGYVSPLTTLILITGHADLQDLIQGINNIQLHAYITKPWDNADLLLKVQQGCESWELRNTNIHLLESLKVQNNKLHHREHELKKMNKILEKKVRERTKNLEQLNESLKHLSLTDGLTGTGNYRYFMDRFTQELERAHRYHQPVSLLMVDVDHFKEFNDLNGHQRGDTALRRIAAVLKKNLRSIDTLARYGGEEFTIVLPQSDAKSAYKIAERIRREIDNKLFPQKNKFPSSHITISIGVATYPNDGKTIKRLIAKADKRLYSAKKNGKNQVILQ